MEPGEVDPLISQERNDTETNSAPIQLSKYRWLILCLFCLYSGINLFQCLQYSIIANIIARYYNISTFAVSWTTLIYMLCCICLFMPASYIIDKSNLRRISILSALLTAVGVSIKIFSVSPDKFYVVIIGQIFCGVGQVFVMSIPSKLAAVWFGKNEVSTACAVALFGSQIGLALGCILSPVLVKNNGSVKEIGNDLYYMLAYNSITACIILALVIIFFRAKPPHPPSNSQHRLQILAQTTNYWRTLKKLITNRDFLFLLSGFGVSNGLWSAFGILLNTIYLFYFPNATEDVGLVALISIISGGCFGCIIFGIILDKTHKFKQTSVGTFVLSALTFLILSLMLEQRFRTAVFILIAIVGFFLGGSIGICYQYTIEVTYPEPEASSCAVMNAIILIFGVLFATIFTYCIAIIGVFWTNIVITILLLISATVILKISPNLRRRNANLIENYDHQ